MAPPGPIQAETSRLDRVRQRTDAPEHSRQTEQTPGFPYSSCLPSFGVMQTMNLPMFLTPLISLIAGILILIMPRLLSMIVAIYLIAVGLIGLFGMTDFSF